ncbi:MAG: hypothetical protein ACFFE4_00580 [Candidatus Thorarchaeota archaeon]
MNKIIKLAIFLFCILVINNCCKADTKSHSNGSGRTETNIIFIEEDTKNKFILNKNKNYNINKKFEEIRKDIPLLLGNEMIDIFGIKINLNKKDWGINPAYKNRILKSLPKKEFEFLIKKIANKYNLYDKKIMYIWFKGEIVYPEPIFYDEIIKNENKIIIYHDKDHQISSFFERIYIDNIKYVYYYKDILCKEWFELYDENKSDIIDSKLNSNI